MNKGMKYQRELVDKLKKEAGFAYESAAIYTILLDLVQGNQIDDIVHVLYQVATDLALKKELDASIEETKNWDFKPQN